MIDGAFKRQSLALFQFAKRADQAVRVDQGCQTKFAIRIEQFHLSDLAQIQSHWILRKLRREFVASHLRQAFQILLLLHEQGFIRLHDLIGVGVKDEILIIRQRDDIIHRERLLVLPGFLCFPRGTARRARDSWLLDVPGSMPSRRAISSCVRPSMSRRTSTAR